MLCNSVANWAAMRDAGVKQGTAVLEMHDGIFGRISHEQRQIEF